MALDARGHVFAQAQRKPRHAVVDEAHRREDGAQRRGRDRDAAAFEPIGEGFDAAFAAGREPGFEQRRIRAFDLPAACHAQDARRAAQARTDRDLRERPRIGGAVVGFDAQHARMLAENIENLPAVIVHEPSMTIIDGAHRVHAARMAGRSRCNKIVLFAGSERHRGQIMDVKITRAGNFTLYGDPAIVGME